MKDRTAHFSFNEANQWIPNQKINSYQHGEHSLLLEGVWSR